MEGKNVFIGQQSMRTCSMEYVVNVVAFGGVCQQDTLAALLIKKHDNVTKIATRSKVTVRKNNTYDINIK